MQRKPWQDLDWRLPVAAVSGSTAVFVTAILVTRLGATPLSAWWTLSTALIVGSLSGLCASLLEGHLSKPAGRIAGAMFASGATSLAIMATTRLAGPLHLAFACVLCLLLTAAAIAWSVGLIGRASAASPADVVDTKPGPGAATIPLPPAPVDAPIEESLPEHVDQTLSRYLADGRDHLEACIRVRFEPGQQSAIVHLPIQPAMQSIPEVECEPDGEEDVRITVDPVQPYGVRLVCRRPAPATRAGEAIVSVLISADRIARAAA